MSAVCTRARLTLSLIHRLTAQTFVGHSCTCERLCSLVQHQLVRHSRECRRSFHWTKCPMVVATVTPHAGWHLAMGTHVISPHLRHASCAMTAGYRRSTLRSRTQLLRRCVTSDQHQVSRTRLSCRALLLWSDKTDRLCLPERCGHGCDVIAAAHVLPYELWGK